MTDKLAQIGLIAGRTKDIAKAVTAIGRTGKAFDTLVHDTGLAIIIASMPQSEGGHLDAGKALSYVQALPAGASRNRIVAWMHEFSNIRVTAKVQEDKSIKWSMKLLKAADADYRKARPIEADATPFWVLNVEREVEAFVFDQKAFDRMLAAILRKAAAAEETGHMHLPPADMAALAALRTMSATVHKRAEGMAKQAATKPARVPPAKVPAKVLAA